MTVAKPKGDEARAEARRQQVLDAAKHCFHNHGFHSASMALIARTSGMSVGHIYHYFANKEAIIEAIVAADEAEKLARFESFRQAPDVLLAMIEQVDSGVERIMDMGNSVLLMEVLAEASRNEEIAALVNASDKASQIQLQELIAIIWRSHHPDTDLPSEETLVAKATVISAIFDGLRIRSIRNPDIDRKAVVDLLRPILKRILES